MGEPQRRSQEASLEGSKEGNMLTEAETGIFWRSAIPASRDTDMLLYLEEYNYGQCTIANATCQYGDSS